MGEEKQPGWNIFKQIFTDHWEKFKELYPKYNTEYYNTLVTKMLACGNPKQMGYTVYRCTNCWQDSRVISMSCKCSLCLKCGKVYVDDWVSQVSRMLHEGIIYRHIVLTVPEILRVVFYNNSEKLLGALMQCGVKCLDDFFSFTSRRVIRGGYIVVLQTHGRSGQYNPHLHIIATSGGLDKEKGKWIHLDYLPYPMLHKKWQWYLLEMVREKLDTEEIDKLVDDCYRNYPKGFVANVQKGDVPNRYKSLAHYLAKYVVSPPISVRRIDRYEKGRVIYHYRSHTMKMVKKEDVDVYTFIGRMIQHVMPKGFKRIRYYGVQATKSFEKNKGIIKEALLKVKNVVKGAVKIIARKKYRARYKDITGNDPLICRNCGKEMEIWEIWHPDYGYIYKGYEEVERNKNGSKEQKILLEKGNGGAIRSPTKGIQLSLFGVWDGASC